MKRRRLIITYIVLILVVVLTLNLGIIYNPDFQLVDFFSGLSVEIFGIIFTVLVVETYIHERKRLREKKPDSRLIKLVADAETFVQASIGGFQTELFDELYIQIRILADKWQKKEDFTKQDICCYQKILELLDDDAFDLSDKQVLKAAQAKQVLRDIFADA